MMEVLYKLVFILLGLLIVLSALGVVFLKNPVHSAVSLLANLCLTAVLYLSYFSAPFVAVVQIIVYVGAVLVFILFAIMMMNLRKEELWETFFSFRTVVGILTAVLFMVMILALSIFVTGKVPHVAKNIHAKDIATLMFTKYALPFELVSVLIFAAACGAIALAKKKM